MKKPLRYLLLLLLALGLTAPARATAPPATGPSLATALNPDGTLRPGANGSFNARQFRMSTAPDGRPVFRPAGTKGAGDERWQDGFGLPTGADNDVRVVVRAGSNIYIGGSFAVVGEAAASRVARWDGQAWHALGTGISGPNSVVMALAVAPNGDLYVGGTFSQAGGIAASNVARWNGTAWLPLGTGAANGARGDVYALAVTANGDVYVGGEFMGVGGTTTASNVAKWNGTAWSALGTGAYEGVNSTVTALAATPAGEVYVGGLFFSVASSIPVGCVAKWSGTAWSVLGAGAVNGVGGFVTTMTLANNGDLYVAGSFNQASGLASPGLARWNGATWSAVSTDSPTGILALAVAANGDVYAGGSFSFIGTGPAYFVARWNGTTWSPVGNGMDLFVFALTLDANGDLYAGGNFTSAGGVSATRLAKWSGTAWSPLATTPVNGLNAQVYALAVAGNGDVYVGGRFSQAGGIVTNGVAKWNGTAWSPLGSGTSNGSSGPVSALAVAPNGDVYAAGTFNLAGGGVASGVAKWNGTAWSSLGTGSSNALVNGGVYALAVAANGDVYAGGDFTIRLGAVSANRVARWNGTAWSVLGSGTSNGVNGLVAALAIAPNGDVYVGGGFTQAGGSAAQRVARWNGTAWSALGAGTANGTNGQVSALALAGNGDLYVGGQFSQAGGQAANLVAKWNGTAWSNVGNGFAGTGNLFVNSLAIDGNGTLYAGGTFTQSGTATMRYVSRWDGTAWNSLGTGANKNVLALTTGTGNKVYVGGAFGTTGDGSKAMAYFGIYDPNAPLATKAATAMPAAELFPNPAHGSATLRLPAGAPRLPLTLVNALGQTVRRYPAPATAEAPLDLRGLPAGTYVVRCGAFSQRLVME